MGKQGKAVKQFSKKLKEEKKAAKAEARNDIAARNEEQKGALNFGHHCPVKDAANTHPIRSTCIKKGHVGYCPVCYEMVSHLYGCSVHKWKGNSLVVKKPMNLKEVLADNRMRGMLGPQGADARTFADQEADEAEQDQRQPVNEVAELARAEDDGQVNAETEEERDELAHHSEAVDNTQPIPAMPANESRPRRRRADEI